MCEYSSQCFNGVLVRQIAGSAKLTDKNFTKKPVESGVK